MISWEREKKCAAVIWIDINDHRSKVAKHEQQWKTFTVIESARNVEKINENK